ncbi:MAG TPA: alpha-glucuronidase [Clostridia bacterium]|nr:alpha-glucuronidase [Clostridia bacterium]
MSEQQCATCAWLPFLPMEIPAGATPAEIARSELAEGLRALGARQSCTVRAQDVGEGYALEVTDQHIDILGGEPGVLYGAYALLCQLALGQTPESGERKPCFPLRMLNHWDNLDGSVERGYAGSSLFFRNGRIEYDEQRLHRYARMLASVGVNAVCLNNVNVRPPADALIDPELLEALRPVTGILRRYGIRLLLAIEFAMPSYRGVGTADPADPRVQAWWAERADRIYRVLPDLLGFLVKADSERRMGPYAYGRSHAEGANMLARALRPHGGILVWRCFVYNCEQDWRVTSIDRPKAAYEHFMPLDGLFDENVLLQIKNGPYDFQVREPVSPLLLSMPRTSKGMELQLAQEYTGQQIDLFFMARQWRDILDVLPAKQLQAVCAVSNLGDDETWAGHDLALANLYAYGRMAWTGQSEPETLAREWAGLTFGEAGEAVAAVLQASPEIYEQYTAPLGLGWMVTPHTHYGPSPEGYEFSAWGTYHRANREAVGIDRSARGTGFTSQYPPELARLYDDPKTCPEKLLLFFHRMRYDAALSDGRTLLQRIYDDHFEGAAGAERLRREWQALAGRVPEDVFARVAARFDRQVENAAQWRDVVNTYFFRFTGIPDGRGRNIYP